MPEPTASLTYPRLEKVSEKFPFARHGSMKVYTMKGIKVELPDKYVLTAKLGQGSYGSVVQAVDTTTGEKVAIKKCGSLFEYPEAGKRILREIKLMQIMHHRNILGILDVLPPNSRTFEEVYIVMPCLDADLSSIIHSQPLTEGHCKYIMYQILRALKYIHSWSVLHRDLKPANVLINFDCHIKICDFGLARGADPSNNQSMTNCVVTPWYRAPELLLGNTRYTSAIDMWATGCIFAEMLCGFALFRGVSNLDQMNRIADTIGVPPDDDLEWVQGSKAREYLKARATKENRSPTELGQHLPPDTNVLALDFLKHALAFNPDKRWRADCLLDHPYVADYHRPESCTLSLQVFKWRWDADCPNAATLRELFWQEMAHFHPEIEEKFRARSSSAQECQESAPTTREANGKEDPLHWVTSFLTHVAAVEPDEGSGRSDAALRPASPILP